LGSLGPGIHVFRAAAKTWMAGTSPAMTSFNLIGKRSNVYGRKMIMGSTVRAVAGAAR
jgi:hypothetical protein